MTKLIIEHQKDGGVYFYQETEKHHKIVEPQRKKAGMKRLDWNDIDNECHVEPGSYMVVPIVKVK